MRIGRNEIIEELTEHMRKSGGEPGEWRVGTASHDGRFKIQDDRENPAGMAGLAYREAHTPYAAADAVDYLVSALGLQLDSEALHGAERCSAPTANADRKAGGAVAAVSDRRTAVGTPPLQEAERSPRRPLQGAPEPGRLVFIYRKTPSAPAPPSSTPPASDHAAFPRRAA
jgi:hypothetical protein